MTSNAEHIATLKEIRRFAPGSEQEAALDAAVEALAPAGECACPKHNGQHLYPCTNPPPPFPLPASPAAVEAWFPAYVVHEMMQMAYRAALPPAGSQLRCANQIEAADTILAMEANRAILTAPPAAPVVSDATFLSHCLSVMRGVVDLCMPRPSRSDDDPTEYHGGQAIDELERCADELKTRLAALSVPATDDKAPAVDALLLRAYEVVHHDADCPAIGGNGDDNCRCDAVPFLRALRAKLAPPTSPHDVDAVRAYRGTVDELPALWRTRAIRKRACGLFSEAELDEAHANEIEAALASVDAVRVDEELVERAVDAYDDVYEAEAVAGVWGDNKNAAMRAALTAALRKPGEA